MLTSANHHIAHLLMHADHIIALNSEGQVVHQGPPERFGGQDDLASVLAGVSAVPEDADKESANVAASGSGTLQAPPSQMQSSVDTDTQRLGDSSVYKYYFSTFGWPKTIIFFALQITLVFCIKFPGMPSLVLLHAFCLVPHLLT
jgi:ATP-binding cassette, subfamily C (CFTR/MRP), member 1